MVLNNSCRKKFSWDRPQELKHLALPGVYYKLLNTSYIFTYNRSRYCHCDQFQGCRDETNKYYDCR